MNESPEVSYWRSQGFWPRACDELARLKIGSWRDLVAYLKAVLTHEEELSFALDFLAAKCRHRELEDQAEAQRRTREEFAVVFSKYVLRIAGMEDSPPEDELEERLPGVN